LYSLLSWWMEHCPEAVPGLIDAAMSSTQASDVVMPAPVGLSFGAPNLAPVTACACGVPSAEICQIADSLIDFFQERGDQQGAFVTSPIGLRFVQQAQAHLSPAFGRDTCMIEL